MASVDLRIDGYGVCPGFPFDEEGSWNPVGLDGIEAPVVHARNLGSRKARRYTLTWEDTTRGQAWLIERAVAQAGVHAAMNFLPPDGGGIVEVRFIGPVEIEQTSATAWKATVDVEELIR